MIKISLLHSFAQRRRRIALVPVARRMNAFVKRDCTLNTAATNAKATVRFLISPKVIFQIKPNANTTQIKPNPYGRSESPASSVNGFRANNASGQSGGDLSME